MPLFIDVHTLDQAAARDLSEAHARDPGAEEAQEGERMPFWIGQKAGKVFWLVEAPSSEAAQAAHRHAHGPEASEIYEVQAGTPWFSVRRQGEQA